MKLHKLIMLSIGAIVLTVGVCNAQVKQNISEEQLTELFGRIDLSTNNFAQAADKSMDKSGFDGSTREDDLNKLMSNLKNATAALRTDHTAANAKANFEQVLHYGVAIENFLKRNPLDNVQTEWTALRSDLGELARGFNITWEQGHAIGAKVGKSDLKNLFDHLEDQADTYKKTLDNAMDNSPLNNTNTEDEINAYVKDFRKATDTLEDNHNDDSAPANAKEVLVRANKIDGFQRKHKLTPEVQSAWEAVRTDLDRLAKYYNVSWQWQQ